MLDIIVLAAGKGTRMKSALPKVLHPVGGKPMLGHVLDTARSLDAENLNVVIGHGAELVEEQFQADDVKFAIQAEQLGTGHAVQQAQQFIRPDAITLILYGDVPLILADTLAELINELPKTALALLTVELEDPTGYGRIIRDEDGKVTAIVEQKDASEEQTLIREGNTGVMAIWGEDLLRWLPQLQDNNEQKEYYLTDVIALAQAEGKTIRTVVVDEEREVLGVNDRQQQAVLERYYQQRKAEQAMRAGATLLDPSRFDCRGELTLGQDVIIDVNCVIEGKVSLGDGVVIGPNCHLKDTSIAAGTHVKANTVCEEATIGENCDVGPFARVRPGTVLAQGAKLGNFVETKKANIGVGSKVNHLTYIGDAEIGEGVNVGAGTITCNYDGVNKFKTEIKSGAFIGSNSSLVAPVTIGENATVAAGSTITSQVDDESLGVARGKQRNIKGWARPTKKQN
ncbi:MAG: bifunctional UDP-N-acetylglucosamine diphosphorylase/glucosamine-1-phosphate N-acetyltransferase GlmU [Pseudomonadota bacterium]|nr:bifunctional UDP-N-acetylglucosamine diphosphorylase/glucosamine-1-phosphate N-acetyltransferase GlmU [Pseudomonadota bacterium]